ncbi:MAG: hypothetical protein JXR96_17125 [Deltaproteobacteria bacterium]|nr:hypothetical protein [Deltaproteobacteria bacterium]
MKTTGFLAVLWAAWLLPQVALPIDYVLSTEQVCPPGSPPQKPERGVPWIHPCFDTTIVRLTDAASESVNGKVSLMYTKFSPENVDGTRALLRGVHATGGYPYSSKWMLYNVDLSDPGCYRFIKQIALHDDENYEPRWSGSEPDVFYYTMNMELHRYRIVDDLPTGETQDIDTLVRDFSSDFPDREKIFLDDEGDCSADNRYWAWFTAKWENGQTEKKEAFSYDVQTDTILGVLGEADLDERHGAANWISMTDSGTRIVIGSDYGTWNSGAYDLDFINGTPLLTWSNHTDTGVDAEGNEVLFGYDVAGDGWGMVNLGTGEKTRILRRPWPEPNDWAGASYGHSAGTLSAAKPGWGVFSAYSGNDCSAADKFDCTLVFLIELKDVGHQEEPSKLPVVWQIAHSYSAGCYAAEPRATTNRAGTRVYFSSKWDYQAGTCTEDDVYDTYIVELPETWHEDLTGPQCADGEVRSCYDGPADTEGVGACRAGTQTCEGESWGACDGQVLPENEVCDDGVDQDCDGADLLPDCTGRDCGDDGCGGSCGSCAPGEDCVDGQCISVCTDDDGVCPDGCTSETDSDCAGTPSDEGCSCGASGVRDAPLGALLILLLGLGRRR